MLNDLRVNWWKATLADGRIFTNLSSEQQGKVHSPWRELERLYSGQIEVAEVIIGPRYARLESCGFPLVCGMTIFSIRELATGKSSTQQYWFVRRDEKRRRLWLIVGLNGTWSFETPPKEEQCPDPEAV